MKYLLTLMLAFMISAIFLFNNKTYAFWDPFKDVCSGNTSAAVCQDKNKPQNAAGKNSLYGPGSILAKITSLIAIIAGVASVIFVIIGGIKYALSGGSGKRSDGRPSGLDSARNTILYAVIGAAIAVVAQSLVVFIINRL